MDYRVARVVRYIIYALVGLLLILLLIAAFNGIKNAFKQSNSSQSTAAQPVNFGELQKSGATVQYVIEGAINAPENHRQVTIAVSPTQRTVEVEEGYDVAPVQSKTYPNSQASYDAFMSALNTAGYSGVKEPTSGVSRTGSCPFGNKYSFQIISGGTLVQDTWNNSCGQKQGTFSGSYSTVDKLFKNQIPNYSDVTTSPY